MRKDNEFHSLSLPTWCYLTNQFSIIIAQRLLSIIQRGAVEQRPNRWWNSQQVWTLNYLKTTTVKTHPGIADNTIFDDKDVLKPCLVTLWSHSVIHCISYHILRGWKDWSSYWPGFTVLRPLQKYLKCLRVVLEETRGSVKSKVHFKRSLNWQNGFFLIVYKVNAFLMELSKIFWTITASLTKIWPLIV